MNHYICMSQDKNKDLWICHKGVSYTMFISLGSAIYECWNDLYQWNNQVFIGSLGLLSLASYNYHKKSCEYIEKGNHIVVLPFFLADILSIHIFSFCCLLTNDSNPYRWMVIISGVAHVVGMSMNITYAICHKGIMYNGEENTIIQYQWVGCPALFDILLICLHSTGTIYNAVAVGSAICIGYLLVYTPFYDFTHIVVHMCLIIMNASLLKCNHSFLS